MINTPNITIMDSAIKKDFNENHTRLQGEKRPFRRSRIKEQGSIFGCRQDTIFELELQGSIPNKRILEKIFLQ